MRWTTKAKIQNAVSKLPDSLSYELYYFLQRNFGNLRRPVPMQGLRAGTEIVERISAVGRTVEGKNFLEVGTGRRINTPLALWLAGAGKIVTVDLNPYMKFSLIRGDLEYIDNNTDRILELFGDKLKQDRLHKLLNLKRENTYTLESLLKLINLEYISPGDASALNLSSSSVDYHFSHNVMEHIPEDSIRNILRESKRVLLPGGLHIHLVDFTDHFAHGDSSISTINFLTFSDEDWDRLSGNRYMYMNRLRVNEIESIFTSEGFNLIKIDSVTDPSLLNLVNSGEIKLSERFRDISDRALTTTSCWLMAENTG